MLVAFSFYELQLDHVLFVLAMRTADPVILMTFLNHPTDREAK